MGIILGCQADPTESSEYSVLRAGRVILDHRPHPEIWRIDGGAEFSCAALGDAEIAWSPKREVLLALDGAVEAIGRGPSSARRIAALVEAEGIGELDHLRGSFAFVAWHRHAGWCAAGRDPTGCRPLYWSSDGGAWILSTDILGVLAGRKRPVRVDSSRLADFLVGRPESAETERSFYAGVSRLPPAYRMLRSKSGRWSHERRYHLEITAAGEPAEDLARTIVASCAAAIGKGRTMAVFLSGGVDSAVVAGAAKQAVGPDLVAFTAVSSDPNCAESTRAEKSAELLGIRQVRVGPETLETLPPSSAALGDDPFDVFMTLPDLLCREARVSGSDCAFTGLDGDLLASVSDEAFLYQAKTGRWTAALVELAARKHTFGFRHCLGSLLRLHYGVFMPWSFRSFIRSRRCRLDYIHQLAARSIRATWARDHDLTDKWRQDWQMPQDPVDPRSLHRRAAESPILSTAFERYDRIATRHGMSLQHPLTAPRVWERALGLSLDEMWRHGSNKVVLRRLAARWVDRDYLTANARPGLNWLFTQQKIRKELSHFFQQTPRQRQARLEPLSEIVELQHFLERAETAWQGNRWQQLGRIWGTIRAADLVSAVETQQIDPKTNDSDRNIHHGSRCRRQNHSQAQTAEAFL